VRNDITVRVDYRESLIDRHCYCLSRSNFYASEIRRAGTLFAPTPLLKSRMGLIYPASRLSLSSMAIVLNNPGDQLFRETQG
jgi:hypothetical protein